jgi:rhodanese-related sulfurtransferase
MTQFMTFITTHWALASAWVIVVILLIFNELRTKRVGPVKISVPQLVNELNNKDCLLIDMRTEDLYKKGHITDAINLAANEISIDNKKIAKYKEQPIILICDHGNSAFTAGLKLKQAGAQNVAVLRGGMNAWREANMPVVK